MPDYTFTLIMHSDHKLTDKDFDQLFEAGCDDATFGEVDGVPFAEFDREAPSLAEAALSAIRAVGSVEGLHVLRIEPDDLVTAAEIATRLGRTRESIRLLAGGRRGPGNFPTPVSHLRTRNRLWRWSDVAAWAQRLTAEQEHDARLLATINAALELRNQSRRLPDRDRQAVEELTRA